MTLQSSGAISIQDIIREIDEALDQQTTLENLSLAGLSDGTYGDWQEFPPGPPWLMSSFYGLTASST